MADFCNEWRNTNEFRKEAIKFEKFGYYVDYPEGTYEFDKYWDIQEKYINEGITNSIGQSISGTHYLYLNFCRIYDKSKKKIDFPEFWDTDAWVFSEYEEAQEAGEHMVVLKARQKGLSLKSVVIPLKKFYFQRASMNYIGSYVEDKANRAWEMLEHMSSHLDDHTDWRKSKSPVRKDFWKAQFKETIQGREYLRGFKSELHKLSFKQNIAGGVGGAVSSFLLDEAGLHPYLVKSVTYIDPATYDGSLRTGILMVVGSVGELDDSEGLKELFYKPKDYGFRAYPNNWEEDRKGTYCGMFIPEYYSLKGFIDEEGNSKLEEAKEWCIEQRQKKKKQSPENYRLYISQKPFTPSEAFAQRKDSIFPIQLIDQEILRITEEGLFGTPVELKENNENRIYHTLDTFRRPIMKFPIDADTNKEGAVVIYDFPQENAPWGMYFAGVDPVQNKKTTTSSSLACCVIMKRRIVKDGVIEPEKLVAIYTGRYDDPIKTNEEMERLIRFYNAQALVEVNVTSFVEHMIARKHQRFLLRKDNIPLIQEMQLNTNVHSPYGVTGTKKTTDMLLDMIIDFLNEEHQKIFDNETGKLVKTVRGVNKIRDIMLLTEFREWREELNVDRVMAFGYALMAASANAQHVPMYEKDQLDYVKQNKEIIKKIRNLPFKNSTFLQTDGKQVFNLKNSPFKHIR